MDQRIQNVFKIHEIQVFNVERKDLFSYVVTTAPLSEQTKRSLLIDLKCVIMDALEVEHRVLGDQVKERIVGAPPVLAAPYGKDTPMTREQYLAFHKDVCEKMQAITKAKNNDYTGGSADPFSNFKLVEEFGFASTEQGFLTRMLDKMARISTFVKKGELQVRDESVSDTLMDLSNYCILMMGYLESKKRSLQ